MSIETQSLNACGLMLQGTIASLFINGMVHPIYTIKSRKMLLDPNVWRYQGIYNGYWAICGTDAATFSAAYLTEDLLRTRTSPIWGAVAAGAFPSPFVAFGEGMAVNRVTDITYSEALQRAVRPAGFAATLFREVPFSVAAFYAGPLLYSHAKSYLQISEDQLIAKTALQISTSAATGAAAGILTTPCDLLRTRVQTSEKPLSLIGAFRTSLAEEGVRGLFKGGGARGVGIALAVTGLDLIKHTFARYAPQPLRAE